MTPSPPSIALPRDAPEPTHPCIRCGREGVPVDRALCEYCNPLELAQPSATQVHGIAALGIIIFVAVLAVLGRLAVAGAGPFQGVVTIVDPAPGGLAVTLLVTNQGTKAAATTCAIGEAGRIGVGAQQVVQTPVIPAEGELRFSVTVTRLGTVPRPLGVACQSP